MDVPQELSDWLESLGLGEHAARFAQEHVDWDLLPELTERDLRELGLTLGQRKRLLRAIAALPARATAAASPAASLDQAERRQLSVMFCDLVGSTELATRLDAEELQEVVAAYRACADAAVSRYAGHVARYMGDGIMVYFGYPRVQEHDPERAVRAALEISRGVARLRPAGLRLRTRIGIATGAVVVGQLIGTGIARERAVVGETPNLAARLQALAEPDTVVVADSTRRLCGGLFRWHDLGGHPLKGFAGERRAWAVVGEAGEPDRFAASRTSALTPLVGRDADLQRLREDWQRAVAGRGSCVLLAGEPGIGKSRLAQALAEAAAAEAGGELRLYGSPYHANSSLYPVIVHLQGALNFTAGDDERARLAKLEAFVETAPLQRPDAAPLLAALLGLPTDRYPALNLTPQRQRAETIELLVEVICGQALAGPVLLLAEDLHWVDPTSLELLAAVARRASGLPLMLVATARPEFHHPWPQGAAPRQISLGRLTAEQVAAVARRVSGGQGLAPALLEQIRAKSDGVPLFVEEMTKAVLAAGADGAASGTPVSVPDSLYDSLMARLDRMTEERELAQVGAAIGRSFSRDLLAAVTGADAASLERSLQRLAEAELVFPSGAGDGNYAFKHALVQDAAYESLLRRRRRALHRRIGEVLESRFPATREQEPEVLAHHFTLAERLDTAIAYWQRAGDRAMRRSANQEAMGYLERALELVRRLPASAERDRRELALYTALGPALMMARGYSAEDVQAAYQRARELSATADDPALLVPALFGLWIHYGARGELAVSRELGEQLFALGQASGDEHLLLETHVVLGATLFHQGELLEARRHLEAVVEGYDAERHGHHAYTYGQDPFVAACAYLANTLWCLGWPRQARATGQAALDRARALDHPYSLALGLAFVARVRQMSGDVAGTQTLARQCVRVSEAQGFPTTQAFGRVLEGWARAAAAGLDAGREGMEQGLALGQGIGLGVSRAWFLGLLAGACLEAGDAQRAASALDEALGEIQRFGAQGEEAEVYRLRARLALALGEDAAARDWLGRALDTAEAQQAAGWRLRAAADLAELLELQGRREAARQALEEAIQAFPEHGRDQELAAARQRLTVLGA